jgi:cell division protein FtsL
MPNGNKNNGNDDIELLPVEFRKPEEKKKKEEKPEVKLFIPEIKKKPQKSTFMGKFFSSKKKSPQAPESVVPSPKPDIETDISIFKIKKEPPKNIPSQPAAPSISARPLAEQKSAPPPPQTPQKTELKRSPNGAGKISSAKPLKKKTSIRQKLGITLIPEETTVSKEKTKRSKQVVLLITFAIILMFIGGGIYWALKWYEEQADLDLQKIEADLSTINSKNKELDSEKTQAQSFQKKLKTVDKLLENHIYWTNFFSFLEKNTVADVYFVNLIGGSDGQIVMSGVAKSYRALARQIVSFRDNNQVSLLSVLSASASVDTEGNVAEINFDAKLKFTPEFFLK